MASYSIITYFSIVVCSIFCMTKYLKVYFWRIFHIKIKAVESLKIVEIFPKSISKVLTDRKDFFNQKSWGKRKVSIVFSPFQCEEGTFLRGPGASGWRVGKPESKFWDVLRHQCADYTEDKTEVSHFLDPWNFSHQRCVRETTFNLSELVDDAWLENPVKPTGEKPNIMVDQLWRPDFTLTWYWLTA